MDELTAEEAAAELGVTTSHIRLLCGKGILKGRKRAGAWWVERPSVEAYRDSYRKPGPRPEGG